jgi:hypothetical protein
MEKKIAKEVAGCLLKGFFLSGALTILFSLFIKLKVLCPCLSCCVGG